MSKYCVKCFESWDADDYVCPCCGSAAVDPESEMPISLKFVTREPTEEEKKEFPQASFFYDYIRISTGESVFDEPGNYLNE